MKLLPYFRFTMCGSHYLGYPARWFAKAIGYMYRPVLVRGEEAMHVSAQTQVRVKYLPTGAGTATGIRHVDSGLFPNLLLISEESS